MESALSLNATLGANFSPVAWQHFHFHGHYTLIVSKHPINLDTMVAPDVGRGGNIGSISNCGSDPGQKCHGKLPDGNFGGLGLQPLWRLSASRRLHASRFRN
jgi:hypothetical protein